MGATRGACIHEVMLVSVAVLGQLAVGAACTFSRWRSVQCFNRSLGVAHGGLNIVADAGVRGS